MSFACPWLWRPEAEITMDLTFIQASFALDSFNLTLLPLRVEPSGRIERAEPAPHAKSFRGASFSRHPYVDNLVVVRTRFRS